MPCSTIPKQLRFSVNWTPNRCPAQQFLESDNASYFVNWTVNRCHVQQFRSCCCSPSTERHIDVLLNNFEAVAVLRRQIDALFNDFEVVAVLRQLDSKSMPYSTVPKLLRFSVNWTPNRYPVQQFRSSCCSPPEPKCVVRNENGLKPVAN